MPTHTSDRSRSCGIIDSTLGLGARAPGAVFGSAPAREIAYSVAALGVNGIECELGSGGDADVNVARAVVAACGATPVHARCRLNEASIDAAGECGAAWVVFALADGALASDSSLDPMVVEAVRRAGCAGLRVCVEVPLGDTPRWGDSVWGMLRACGVDRVRVVDAAGALYPWEVGDLLSGVRDRCGGLVIEAGFADDCGMADANALTAARAGIGSVVASVNGIGARCGLTDTILLAVSFGRLGLREAPRGAAVADASAVVRAHSRLRPDRWRPIIGDNACTASPNGAAGDPHPAGLAAEIAADRCGRALRVVPSCLPSELSKLVNYPNVVSATELRYHRHGPGDRYLMLDERVVPDARQYCIVRHVPPGDPGPGHVDLHRHHVDSLFLFVGYDPGLSGLRAEVRLGDDLFAVESPCSVFIPSGVVHSYRVLGGSGIFVNHVLEGDYNSSLLRPAADEAPPPAPGMNFVLEFVRDRLPGAPIEAQTRISELIDSLLFLDLFLHIESAFGEQVSLDEIATCVTFGELADRLSAATLTRVRSSGREGG